MKKRIVAFFTILVSMVTGVCLGTLRTQKVLRREIVQNENLSEKHLDMFLLINEWLKIKQKGKNLTEYFEKKGYKTIAIYGMSYIGERLFEELKNSSIIIKYGIDKTKNGIYFDLDIVTVEDELATVDAIIVTAFHYFDEIEKQLSRKVQCPIISIEDILYTF